MDLKKKYFEKKVYCNKSKSKLKSRFISKFDLKKMVYDINNNPNQDYSLVIKKIYLELNNNSDDYGFIESIISKMKIIISSDYHDNINHNIIEQNIFEHNKIEHNKILEIPGYICKFKFVNPKLLELDIWFENFFPNGLNLPIPINNDKQKYFINPENFYLIILFNKLIEDELVLSSYFEYYLKNTNIDDEQYYLTITFDKKENDNNENGGNEKKSIHNKHWIYNFNEHKTIFIQQTQTQNFRIIKKKILNNIFTTMLRFENMCRGFWIRMNKIDYDKLSSIKFTLEGLDRLELDIISLEALGIEKKYIDNSVIIFINLELGSNCWTLPNTISESKNYCSNSINLSRFDSIKILFYFNSNQVSGEYISITGLTFNLLDIYSGSYKVFFKL
jgi:hypothetical protein